ncbi:glycosyltransferase family 2 protein [Flavobacteriaceae bacterium XHP0103]|uniref:glycosyltransferase family 2 protein n=1 Tax=Marixanthotalea marina TaxID=2844359 RepID=UPI002989D164|nr:glycosyltransferase family 2 protein [Marixanthotalea marina]MBU3822744.1 glycosyltransferase family 2 protein [Marixanthotalea marina]
MEHHKLYIIIVTYNGLAWLDTCLSSCQGYPVIVVDNQSTDDTVSFIKKYYPNVEVLPQAKNLGFGAANNIGIKQALSMGADYVFLLNQDAYLGPDTIETLIKIHKKYVEYGVLSPIHLNGNGSHLDFNFSYYFKQNNDLLNDALNTKKIKSVYEVPFVNAAAWLLPKNTLEIVGGFDPMFFHYGEDDNYCQRVLFHGFKVGVVPHTFVKHDRARRLPKTALSLQDRLVNKERQLKTQWANLNSEPNDEIEKSKKDLLKLVLKLVLKLKFKKARYCFLELQLVKKIETAVLKSRVTNKEKGLHYLS